MSETLRDEENVAIASVAAVITTLTLQPTLYLKTAAAQRLPFTLNPAVLYRGTGASLTNEILQMGAQFLLTGIAKRMLAERADTALGTAARQLVAPGAENIAGASGRESEPARLELPLESLGSALDALPPARLIAQRASERLDRMATALPNAPRSSTAPTGGPAAAGYAAPSLRPATGSSAAGEWAGPEPSAARPPRASAVASIGAAMLGGAMTALLACPIELVMIQQQIHGTTGLHTIRHIVTVTPSVAVTPSAAQAAAQVGTMPASAARAPPSAAASPPAPSAAPPPTAAAPRAPMAPPVSRSAAGAATAVASALPREPTRAAVAAAGSAASAAAAAAAQLSACAGMRTAASADSAAAACAGSHPSSSGAGAGAGMRIVPWRLLRGLYPTMARDAVYVGGMLGVTPVVQELLEPWLAGPGGAHGKSGAGTGRSERSGAGPGGGAGSGAHAASASERAASDGSGSRPAPSRVASLAASVIGGTSGALISHPWDVVKTTMQGDVHGRKYGTTVAQAIGAIVRERGPAGLMAGCWWRTLNITISVFIVNECFLRLAPRSAR